MDGREDAAMIKDSEFEEFFTSQYGRLCWLGFLLSGTRAEAEELAQDALVRTWWRWAVYRRPDERGAYDRFLRYRQRRLLGAAAPPACAWSSPARWWCSRHGSSWTSEGPRACRGDQRRPSRGRSCGPARATS
jgi:hypothetical protein